MKKTLLFLSLFVALNFIFKQSFAQLPNCASIDSTYVFLQQGGGIMAYDPAQPLSGTNPFPYLPSAGGGGLTISMNLNGGTPNPAFYSNVSGSYAWWNGATWQSTGHAVSTVNPGGGMNFIYSKNGGTGEINKYDGTGPATYLMTTYPGSGPYDLVTDAQDNFYHLMTSTQPGKIIKYSPAGLPLDSFVVTGHPIQTAGGGFAMIGNTVFAVFNSSPSLYSGPIISGAVVLAPVGQTSASDVATCPSVVPSISSNPLPVAEFSISNDTICAGTCITFTDLSINSPTSWTWTFPTGTPNLSILQNPGTVCFNTPGTHVVQLIVSNAVGSDTVTHIVQVDYLAPPTIVGDREICIGESTTLTANPVAQTYNWNTGDATQSITVTPSTTTNYSLVVTQGVCTGTAEVTVEVNPLPSVTLTPYLTGCDNNSGSITSEVTSGTAPFTYNWSNGQTGADASAIGVGNYTVVVTDAKTCTAQSNATVGVYPNPIATATPVTATVKYGDTIQLNATGGKYYHWTSPTYLSSNYVYNPLAFPMVDMEYCVEITDEHDCKDTACVDIKVTYCEDFFIPNAFSPNGDGLNDKFFVKGNCVLHSSFSITNRWGQQIFIAQHDNESWDGTYKGVKQDPGTYFYYAEIEFANGKRIIRKGDVILVR
jgi:gliding motility-associated-like protein